MTTQRKVVGLKFLLADGVFLSVILWEDDARKILDGWRKGSVPAESLSSKPGDPTDIEWVIDPKFVRAIHTFDAQEFVTKSLVQGREGAFPGLPVPGTSGNAAITGWKK